MLYNVLNDVGIASVIKYYVLLVFKNLITLCGVGVINVEFNFQTEISNYWKSVGRHSIGLRVMRVFGSYNLGEKLGIRDETTTCYL